MDPRARNPWAFVAVVLGVSLFIIRSYRGPDSGTETIEFRGERFQTSKRFWGYESYKNDPDNLASNEFVRIEKAILDANVGPSFDSRKSFISAVMSLRFPGYGLSTSGEISQADGSALSMDSIEIPHRDKRCILVARRVGDQFTVVDDFVVGESTNEISNVRLEGSLLRYFNANNLLLREKPL